MSSLPVQGQVAPGFEQVRDEFERNFRDRGEVGAAVAVYQHGELVVDLWGGYRDPKHKQPWDRDTLVMVFSTTKGLAALTLAHAHSRGLFDYDERVAAYWPGFGQAGKQEITVRQLLGHQAGLPIFDRPVGADLLGDPRRLAPVLEAQAPLWEPGSRHGYHAVTVGLYVSELMRRIDPQRRSLGAYFAEEIASGLDLEFYFGTPDSVAADRVASLSTYGRLGLLRRMNEVERPFLRAMMKRGSLTQRVMTFPKVKTVDGMMQPPYRSIELAAANGIGQVRSIAKLFGVFATGGSELGIGAATTALLEATPTERPDGERDLVLHVPARFHLGLWKPNSHLAFGTDSRAYASPGAGGSIGLADPATGIGFAYAPNFLGIGFRGDRRMEALRSATFRCAQAASPVTCA